MLPLENDDGVAAARLTRYDDGRRRRRMHLRLHLRHRWLLHRLRVRQVCTLSDRCRTKKVDVEALFAEAHDAYEVRNPDDGDNKRRRERGRFSLVQLWRSGLSRFIGKLHSNRCAAHDVARTRREVTLPFKTEPLLSRRRPYRLAVSYVRRDARRACARHRRRHPTDVTLRVRVPDRIAVLIHAPLSQRRKTKSQFQFRFRFSQTARGALTHSKPATYLHRIVRRRPNRHLEIDPFHFVVRAALPRPSRGGLNAEVAPIRVTRTRAAGTQRGTRSEKNRRHRGRRDAHETHAAMYE